MALFMEFFPLPQWKTSNEIPQMGFAVAEETWLIYLFLDSATFSMSISMNFLQN